MQEADRTICSLEQALAAGPMVLKDTIDRALTVANDLMLAVAAARGQPLAELNADSDPLEVFKGFVKGDASFTAIRDNVRELVYYRNCLAGDRADALPVRPEAMTVRTIRHIYLYLRTRALKEYGLTGV
ncbi:MAG: hypothetical protein ACYCXG_06000 [Acidiferrobacter sp.]